MRRPVLIALGIIFGLLVAEALYVPLAGRLLASRWLAGQLASRLESRADRFQLRFGAVTSPAPLWLRVRDLELIGQTPNVRWRIRAERADGSFALLPLLRRRLRFDVVRARGIEVAVERLPKAASADGVPAALPPGQPTIGVFHRRLPRRPPGSGRGPGRWTIEFADLRLDDVRDLWIERFRLRGRMRAEGAFRLAFGREFLLRPSRLIVSNATLAVGGVPAVESLGGEATARLDPLRPGRDAGWSALSFASGRLRLAGELSSIAALETFLAAVPWLDLSAGSGPLRAEVGLAQGRLTTGSSAEVASHGAVIDLLQYRVGGDARLSWRVESGRAIARAEIRDAAIGYRGAAASHLRAPVVLLDLSTDDLALDGTLSRFAARADLPRAEAPDLRRYNDLLPPGSGLALARGSGIFASHLRIEADGRARGSVRLTTSGLAARVRDVDLAGDCRLDLAVASADVRELRFDLDGSRVRCDGLAVGAGGERDGWFEGLVEDGVVAPGAAEALRLAGTVRARDATPAAALFSGRLGAGLAARVLRGKPVSGRGEVALGAGAWTLAATGRAEPSLGLRARLTGKRGPEGRDAVTGALLVLWGRRPFGLELAPGERRLHLRQAEAWFERAHPLPPRARSASAGEPGRVPTP